VTEIAIAERDRASTEAEENLTGRPQKKSLAISGRWFAC
jgi:hypothetical protein